MWFIVWISLWTTMEIFSGNKNMLLEIKWMADSWQDCGRKLAEFLVLNVLILYCEKYSIRQAINRMTLKVADKIEFTSSMSGLYGTKGIHLVRRVYIEDDSFEYAVACYCATFTEGDEIIKVDNEQELTCPDCIERLERM